MSDARHARHYLTIDVEDSFHSEDPDVAGWGRHALRVEGSTERVLASCADAGVRGTFFVLGWVAERCPALVRRIAAAGHEVASHGYGHRFVYHQQRADFLEDVRRARAILEDLTGVAVLGYRAPYFSVVARTPWAHDALIEAGHLYSSSVFPGANPRYGIPGHPHEPTRIEGAKGGAIVEIPVTAFFSRIGCGGVYFRALPYRFFAAQLDRHERLGRRAVFYLHPWELDPGIPPPRGSLGLRLRHGVGLRGAARRFSRLLSEFSFEPLSHGLRREGRLDAPAGALA